MIGKVFGSYKVVSQLGEGGMGVVYLAEHPLIGRKAAVKVLLPQFSAVPDLVQRFFNEARATTLIKHSGLVDIFDFGFLPSGNAYLVMEFLDGESLKARILREGRLAPALLGELTRQMAAALVATHAAGIVHRDLKPDNVFLVPTAELPSGVRVKLLDFGIAKLAGDLTGSENKTNTDALLGTPRWMSPEQCRGAGGVDHRSDIYSLGCMMFAMASGNPPFSGAGPGDVIAAHLTLPIPDLRALAPDLPDELLHVTLRALAKRPEDRYQTMVELLAELDRAIAEKLVAPPPPPRLPDNTPSPRATGTLTGTASELIVADAGAPARRRRRAALGVGTALVAAVAMVFAGWMALRRPAPPVTKVTVLPVVATPPLPETRPDMLLLPAAAPAPPPVKLMIDSLPSGAEVFRAADGVRLGKTPLETEALRSPGSAVFFVKMAGYQAERIELPADHDGKGVVKMTRLHISHTKTGGVQAPVKDGVWDPFAK